VSASLKSKKQFKFVLVSDETTRAEAEVGEYPHMCTLYRHANKPIYTLAVSVIT
jgi:hypothetical protein